VSAIDAHPQKITEKEQGGVFRRSSENRVWTLKAKAVKRIGNREMREAFSGRDWPVGKAIRYLGEGEETEAMMQPGGNWKPVRIEGQERGQSRAIAWKGHTSNTKIKMVIGTSGVQFIRRKI